MDLEEEEVILFYPVVFVSVDNGVDTRIVAVVAVVVGEVVLTRYHSLQYVEVLYDNEIVFGEVWMGEFL